DSTHGDLGGLGYLVGYIFSIYTMYCKNYYTFLNTAFRHCNRYCLYFSNLFNKIFYVYFVIHSTILNKDIFI
ncbi:hypothetical protein C446_07539, partial [Halobiforma nitratireducens JCM 10879]